MDSAAKIATVTQYLRRRYSTDLDALKALAERVAATATDAVTLTGQSFEGASHSGALTFEPIAYLAAIESLIAELDSTTPKAPPAMTHADFGCGYLQT